VTDKAGFQEIEKNRREEFNREKFGKRVGRGLWEEPSRMEGEKGILRVGQGLSPQREENPPNGRGKELCGGVRGGCY